MSSHNQLVAELTARWPEHRIGPGLDRERAVLDLLGNPQQACPVIQIAGTNGKGSTAIMVDSLLRSAGLRVGRYCSPHLVDVTERICIDGRPVSHDLFDETWRQVEPMVGLVDAQHIDGIEMTFFEVMTAMAFAAFADAPVDVAVVEVGLGGRWDATNVADANIAVVTPVAMDHMHILGDSLDKIAAEKAGIIKPGCTPVIAGQEAEAAPVLLAQCADAGVKPLLEGPDWGLLDRRSAIGGQVLRIQTASGPLGELFLPVFGEHMAHNAAQAVAAVEALTGPLKPAIIEQGLAAVQAPARLEVVRRSPLVILDTFHNPHGAASAIAGVRESFEVEPLIAVVVAHAYRPTKLTIGADGIAQHRQTMINLVSRGLSSPLERSVRLGYEPTNGDRAANIFAPSSGSTSRNDVGRHVVNPQHVLVSLRGQTAHEIQLDLTPPVSEGRSNCTNEIFLGHLLIDNPTHSLGSAFRSEGQTGTTTVTAQLVC